MALETLRITPDTVTCVPIGTRVRFFYGCGWDMDGPQEEDGLVVDYRVEHHPALGAAAWLIVETETGDLKHVGQFTERGIGCRLLKEPGDV